MAEVTVTPVGQTPLTLPNLLIIGAARSGTSSLYNYLKAHPEVFMSEQKELRYFVSEELDRGFNGPGDPKKHFIATLEEYSQQFEGANGAKVIGEASPAYMAYPTAPRAIHRTLPDAKLVAILREPVSRAFSHYHRRRQRGKEPCASFEEAVREEPRRIAEGWEYAWHYVRRGYYFEQLAPYFELFDRSQMLVLLTDDLQNCPEQTIERLYEFAGIDASFMPDVRRRYAAKQEIAKNKALDQFVRGRNPLKRLLRPLLPEALRRKARKEISRRNTVRHEVSVSLRSELRVGYREDIVKLQDLIGRDLSAWLT